MEYLQDEITNTCVNANMQSSVIAQRTPPPYVNSRRHDIPTPYRHKLDTPSVFAIDVTQCHNERYVPREKKETHLKLDECYYRATTPGATSTCICHRALTKFSGFSRKPPMAMLFNDDTASSRATFSLSCIGTGVCGPQHLRGVGSTCAGSKARY
jgi:hypothetical protein